MSLSRRTFLRAVGIGSAGTLVVPSWMHGRGLEAATAPSLEPFPEGEGIARLADPIRLDSNENPNGPVPAAVRAILGSMKKAAYYPSSGDLALREAIAKTNGVPVDQVTIGCGSVEILRSAVQAFCSPTRPLVAALPSYEAPMNYARAIGVPVRDVPVDTALGVDFEAMLRAVPGAGLVFLCNPNNPTGLVNSGAAIASFVERALAADPDVIVLVDEAYHEFVDDASYATALPLIAKSPRVLVTRTLSKIYGIAGLRGGYGFAQPATLQRLERYRLPNGVGALTQVAAIAALADPAQVTKERKLNRESRAFTTKWFADAGFRVTPSDTNFVLVDVRRDAAAFRAACRDAGVAIGRPFRGLTTHARISIGTMAEMRQALPIFGRILS